MRMAKPILIAAILVLVAAPADGVQMKLGAQICGVRNAFTGELPDEGKWKGRFGLGADPTTIGALFDAGALVPLGRQFLTLELRYVQGLDDIVARNGGESESGLSSPSVQYRGLQLMIGHQHHPGRRDRRVRGLRPELEAADLSVKIPAPEWFDRARE